MMMRSARRAPLASTLTAGLVLACIELNVEPPGVEPGLGGGGAGSTEAPLGGHSGYEGTSGETADPSAGSSGAVGHGGQAGGGGESGGDAGAANASGGAGGSGASGGTSSDGRGGMAGAGTPGRGGTTGRGGSPSGGTASGGTEFGGAASGGESVGGSLGEPVDFSGGGPLDPNDRCGLAELTAEFSRDPLVLSGNLAAHDPAILSIGDRYFVFHTGRGIPVKTSRDLLNWTSAGAVFTGNPSWIAGIVPGVSDLWAPDVSRFGGSYHLYYSASTFGSNRSCIGHATRATLDSGSWVDRGPVICSNPNGGSADDWNAIDPNAIVDAEGVPWLVFGSFWSGIKAIKLTESGSRADTSLHSLAARVADGKAIEAPFVVRRCGYYYLFVSFDYCCRGSTSTYRTVVGRSSSILGPYSDRWGRALLEGGGAPLLEGTTRWRGPGHNAVLFVGSQAYNVYHAYDANDLGRSYLRLAQLAWDADGWPASGGP